MSPHARSCDELRFPAKAPRLAGVVWLHGFGGCPEEWADAFAVLRDTHPRVEWIHLRAASVAQACFGGEPVDAWGSFLEEGCTSPSSADYNSSQIVSESTARRVRHAIDELVSRGDDAMPASHVVVGGFSMGAAAAAEAALRQGEMLGGLIMLNGWLTPSSRFLAEKAGQAFSRALVSHGSADEQVDFGCGEEAVRLLLGGGVSVQFAVQRAEMHVDSGFGGGRDVALDFLASFFSELEAHTGADERLTTC
ncbi:MAG: hypothetical protein SGPRY_010047 [Prymnesium sp.]